MLYLNDPGRRLVEGNSLEVGPASLLDFFVPEDRAYVREVVLTETTRRGRWSGDWRIRNLRTNAPVAVALDVFRLSVGEGAQTFVAVVAQDNSVRFRTESRTRTLVDAGAVLSNLLNYEQTFRELARLVVGGFATYCVIDVLFENGESNARRQVRRVAAYHADRSKRELVSSLNVFAPDLESSTFPINLALLEGTSTLMHEVTGDWIDGIAMNRDHARVLHDLGLRSWLTVAIVARGKILGSLTCGLADETEHRPGFSHGFDAEDLFFAEELGRRAGSAIENARLYEYQRNIAATLQDASLPSSLPRIDHLRLSADYRPGSDEATIGGDWYDAFELSDTRVVLTVGDVLGHGLHAAVAMTKLRQAIQAAAMIDADPAVMLEVADSTLFLHDPEGFATAIAAVFDPRDHTLTIASAGHPPPLRRTREGSVDEIAVNGPLLGLRSGIARKATKVILSPETMLVFFTDGLVEMTRDIAVGLGRLRHALEGVDLDDHRQVARLLTDAVLAGEKASDDIAVLCAWVAPPATPEDPPKQTEYE